MLVATWCTEYYYKLDETRHTLKPSKVVESCTTSACSQDFPSLWA